MSGRVYTAIFEDVAVAAIQDLFNLLAATNVGLILHEVTLHQITQTASELLQLKFQRATTDGTGGTTPTPRPTIIGMPASDTVVRVNDATTQGTEGDIVRVDGWQVVYPYLYLPAPEDRIEVPGGGRLIVELETVPGAAMVMGGTITWAESG